MAFISAINTVKVVLEQLFGTSELANIVYFLKSGGWSEAEMTALLDDVETWWITYMQPYLGNALSLTGLTATDMSSATGPVVTKAVSPAEVGAGTSDPQAANVTAVITFRTAGRGRSSRGRNYIPGLTQDVMDSVTDVLAGWCGYMIDAYEAFSDVEVANTCTHVVASFYHEKAPRATALLQPVTGYTMDTAVDSQRRRLRGRGI